MIIDTAEPVNASPGRAGRGAPACRAGRGALASRGRYSHWRILHAALAALLLSCSAPEASDPPEARPSAAAPSESTGAPSPARPSDPRPVVLFLGDSLSAGYGLSSEQAFPALVQNRIDEAGLIHRVVNAGVSGDTTAGGLRRLDWLLRQPVDVLVVQLGGNDMLRGQDVDAMRSNLRAIAERARERYPGIAIVLAGMQAAPNLGFRYAGAYNESFPALAEELGAALIPFLLDGVAADPKLNQADRIHPTAEGHRRVAATVWKTLEPVLRGRAVPPDA